MTWDNHTLHDPWWLLALAVIPLVAWLRGRRGVPALVVPFAAAWYRPSLATFSRSPVAVGVTGLALLVLALARPQRVDDKRQVHQQGYDLILAIDLSGSMLAEDNHRPGEGPNRLQVIKPVIQAFIQNRPNDRIGIVVFATQAYTLSPLTFDHAWLSRQIDRIEIGTIDADHTAIGDGLGVALTRLEQAGREEGNRRKGAFVVLLTDGSNNSGVLAPLQAAEIARARGIPVYTVGAGKDGYTFLPVRDERGQTITYTQIMADLDENTLTSISEQTGGRFFRARDAGTIETAFKSIDEAQKIEFEAKSYLLTTELFPWFAVPGILCVLLAGLVLAWPNLRSRAVPARSPFISGPSARS
ncbi:MAG TPA: VWA domain-containing protein [Opitutaceae bacterium]|nr:VWA domain-containing protein [Opitutaceae bacterium]